MTKEEKIAMARIISDMIKADNIIEESEIRTMKELMEKYKITEGHMKDSRKILFSSAVNTLSEYLKEQEGRQHIQKQILEDTNKISISDNTCVPREALLQTALEYCLQPHKANDRLAPSLFACPTGESTTNDLYMVYIEHETNDRFNEEVKKNFRLFVKLCRLSGFHFIYIPKLVEEFQQMKKTYVIEVIKYMAPNLSESQLSEVYNRLCNMTTSSFCNNILKERLQVNIPYDIEPSLLINIGTSVVPYCPIGKPIQYYSEFLRIPIDPNTGILGEIENVLDCYQSNVNTYQMINPKSSKGQFKYFGFYKALFDFLIAPPPAAPDLLFIGQMKGDRYQVVFKTKNEENTVNLSPKEYDLYKKIAEKSYIRISDGTRGLSTHGIAINTTLCRLRGKIRDAIPSPTYSEQYLPIRDNNKLVLNLDKSKMFVREYQDGQLRDIPIYP